MPALPQCTITGTLYDGSGNLAPDGFVVTLIRTRKSGQVLQDEAIKFLVAGGLGVVTITAPRLSTIRLFSEATAGTTDFRDEPDLTVPDSSTAALEDLIPSTTLPAAGITVKDEGVALSQLVAAMNFVGAGVSVALVAGVAVVTIPGGAAGLTADRVMVTDGSGQASASSVTTTKLGFLDATSSIQTQLNAKASSSHTHAESDVTGLVADLLTLTNAVAGKQSTLVNSAGLLAALSDETGTGVAVFNNTPTLIAPLLGTPTSGVLTLCTGLPPTTGIVGWPANAAGALTNNGSGTLSWVAGANAALSNLASVSINTDLLPASTQGLGNASFPFLALFIGNTTQYESVAQSAGLVTHSALGSATNIGWNWAPRGTGLFKITSPTVSGAAVFEVRPVSGNSFTRINDNGTMVIDADVTTGVTPLEIKYNGAQIAKVNFLGGIFGVQINAASGLFVADSGSVRVVSNTMPLKFGASGDAGIGWHAAGIMEANSGTIGTLRDFMARNFIVGIAGGALQVKEGTNATMGTGTLNGTTEVTINTTAVTANSRIFLSIQAPGGTPSGTIYVSSRVGGTSFGVKSLPSDTSTFSWIIVEPAA